MEKKIYIHICEKGKRGLDALLCATMNNNCKACKFYSTSEYTDVDLQNELAFIKRIAESGFLKDIHMNVEYEGPQE